MWRSLIFVVACSGPARPAVVAPKGPDAKQLAAQLHGDLVELGAIAKRKRGDCPGLVGELKSHVALMKQHADEVNRAATDPKFAEAWRAEAATYADRLPALTDAIALDLKASYDACKSDELLTVINGIPEW